MCRSSIARAETVRRVANAIQIACHLRRRLPALVETPVNGWRWTRRSAKSGHTSMRIRKDPASSPAFARPTRVSASRLRLPGRTTAGDRHATAPIRRFPGHRQGDCLGLTRETMTTRRPGVIPSCAPGCASRVDAVAESLGCFRPPPASPAAQSASTRLDEEPRRTTPRAAGFARCSRYARPPAR